MQFLENQIYRLKNIELSLYVGPSKEKTDNFKAQLTSNKTIIQIKKKLAGVMSGRSCNENSAF